MEQNYYLKNKKKMIQSVKKQINFLAYVLSDKQDKKDVDNIINEIYKEFENLLPQLPYIGGMKNSQTKKIVGTAPYLCFYKVMKRRNMDIHEIGKLIYEASSNFWSSYPKIAGLLMRKLMKSSFYFNKFLVPDAERSHIRKYKGDFVYSAINGDSKNYDFGMDYRECGICKYFHEQGADELTPYMCLLDYAQCEALKIGLERNMTIAEGADRCDFRIKIGGQTRKDLKKYFTEM